MSVAGRDLPSDAVLEPSCVVGDKLSCGTVLDDDKQLTVYFMVNNHKVSQPCLCLSHVTENSNLILNLFYNSNRHILM